MPCRLICAVLALSAGLSAYQAPANATTQAAVAKVGAYVDTYRKQFSAVVCEERQTQTLIKPNGKISKTRVLVSDLMFVKVGESWILQSFRDVISVDGKAVRNRDDRLRKLFLAGNRNPVEQARAIGQESGRYNLGINRVGNSPLLPIMLFDPHIVSNFSFDLSGETLTYNEPARPTFLSFHKDGKRGDLPATGSVVIDPASGLIRAATLKAESPDAPVSTTFTVQYVEDAALKMLVPAEMTERYHFPAKPTNDHFESKATYSAFRRFQVIVDETIK